jgi:hypothetical protein
MIHAAEPFGDQPRPLFKIVCPPRSNTRRPSLTHAFFPTVLQTCGPVWKMQKKLALPEKKRQVVHFFNRETERAPHHERTDPD